MSNKPKISIIIPIYNGEKYLRQCLDSVITQTLKDIEIICIDDCSSDNSPEILSDYLKIDTRIEVITHDKNLGTLKARKTGVLQATGEYIMFLDNDDTYEPFACEELYGLIKHHNVDILHFETSVVGYFDCTDSKIKTMGNLLSPYKVKLINDDVFNGCFLKEHYTWTLWNKIFSRPLCQKAYMQVNDGYSVICDDLHAYFFMALLAKSYYGITGKSYYKYNYGLGITGHNTMDIETLKKFCSQAYTAREIEDFLVKNDLFEKHETAFSNIFRRLIGNCIFDWVNLLESKDCPVGFDLLLQYWNPAEVMSYIAKNFYSRKELIAYTVLGAKSLESSRKTINTIGVFYHRMSIGGVERVLSLLIPLWISMGYKVVLFTDEPQNDNDYTLPDSVERIVIPPFNKQKERYSEFQNKLKEYNIDIMLYQASSSNQLLFDMLLVKAQGIPFVLTRHESFASSISKQLTEATNNVQIFKLANWVTVLSRCDQRYWNLLGVNAHYLPNPLTFSLENIRPAALRSKTILWIGRIEASNKKYLDAVRIMAEVVKAIPDARLLIVGRYTHTNDETVLIREIEKLDLQNNIELCGPQSDVSQFYSQSSVHLMTSAYEGAPMVVGESKAFGIPLVLYELPYLEMLRDRKGYISVKQNDIQAAADAVVKLLSDEAFRISLGREARESIDNFDNFDLAAAWQNVFNRVTAGTEETSPPSDEDARIILDTILFHSLVNTQKQLNKKNRELAIIRNSLSFRIGSLLTYIPRLFRDGIQCCKHNGLKYTIRRAIKKFTHL